MDYVVFSSGAGIFNWKKNEIVKSWLISKIDIQKVINTIKPYNLNFTIHLPIPNNHHILLYDKHIKSEDLQNYVSFYKQFASSIDMENLPESATQLIVLLNHHSKLFNQFSKNLPNLKSILATSPIDNKSMWMEVFNPNVSKANGVAWIAKYLKINNPSVFAIGNDYNDIDLLEYCKYPFVVENAPEILKNKFSTTLSNNENALTSALNKLSINIY